MAAAVAAPETEACQPQEPEAQKCEGKGRNGVWLTAGIIVADVVGAGILGMPGAIADFGWLMGAVLMAVMLAANVHISLLMWRIRVNSPACVGARSYMEWCAGAFSGAPQWQRTLAASVTGATQPALLFGVLGLYLLSAAKGLGMVFYQIHVCLPLWGVLAALALLPFAGTSREMGSHQYLIWLNIATLCGTVCIPLVYYAVAGVEHIRPPNSNVYAIASTTPAGVLSSISTFSFGMSSQLIVPEIISEMADRSQFGRAYGALSSPFQLTAFLVAGVGGYLFIGDKVSGMLNENLPFGTVFQIGAACLVTHMLISYLIKGVVFCRAVHERIDTEYADPGDNRPRSWAGWNAVVLTTLAAAYLFANVVPFFGVALDLLGASLVPLLCWLIPIAAFVRWQLDAGDERPHVSILEWVAIALEFVLALVLMVFGTIFAVRAVFENWHSFGYPFECHCSGIWETCECSAGHAGMEGSCPHRP